MPSCDPFPVRKLLMLLLLLLFCAFAQAAASAQTAGRRTAPQRPQTPAERPTLVSSEARRPAPAARASESACGGFIEQTPQAAAAQIVGAEDERERRTFAEGDLVYLDAGSQAGVRVGQEFTVVRPRGQFRSKFSRKTGPLGVYTQELGRLRVVRVRDRVSVAMVERSCADLLLGDLLRPAPARPDLPARAETALDRFAEPTGKQTGRLVLARDGREMVSRDEVVFVDLGAEDGVKVGDYLTVFRPEEHAVIVDYGDEVTGNINNGFQSDSRRGGRHSNKAQRVKDVSGSESGDTVKTPDIKRKRPAVPRKVVGELVVLRVEGRTATAVVTRVAQEIHTGDAVEVQ
ncbi:MAG TPA: hypothetical protein VN282_22445 [Pyrinomonadaceae bacterium]|nr:hypothetical protein [Pyrinomonadaceae bacterium]